MESVPVWRYLHSHSSDPFNAGIECLTPEHCLKSLPKSIEVIWGSPNGTTTPRDGTHYLIYGDLPSSPQPKNPTSVGNKFVTRLVGSNWFVSETTKRSNCPNVLPYGFFCLDGVLISQGSVDVPTIIIPPNVGGVVVNGNLSISGSLIIGSGVWMCKYCFNYIGDR